MNRLSSTKAAFGPLVIASFLASSISTQARAQIDLGAAGNYGILYEGLGGNTLTITNPFITGNIGIGNTGNGVLNGTAATFITGSVDYSAANTGQNSGPLLPSGGVNYNVSQVTSALNTVNALNTALGAVNGTDVVINNTLTIDISSGALASGTGFSNVRFFDVTTYALDNTQTLTLDGKSSGQSVVLNFTASTLFRGQVLLTGGLTADQVLFNFVGGAGGTGGPTLAINNGGNDAHPNNVLQGIFLDPNGQITINQSRINMGRIFGGDSATMIFNNSTFVAAPVPEPSTLGCLAMGAITLSVLSRRTI
jgi:hypothetical protein